jgi:Zn-dependent protease
MFDFDPVFIATFLPALLFSLTFHEAAHAWMSNRLGDPTARLLGRLSLNPLVHLDLFGTMMLFVSGFRFGWAKPVPVDPHNFREPRRGMVLTAAAGPASNILLAIICGALIRAILSSGVPVGIMKAFTAVIAQSLITNVGLAVFNMIPLPPLDGSRILVGISPPEWGRSIYYLERFGPLLLMAVIFLGMFSGVPILGMFLGPIMSVIIAAFSGVSVSTLYALIYG